MSHYLERFGHEVVVLTTSAFGAGGPPCRETVRAPDALGARVLRPLLPGGPEPARGYAAARDLLRRLVVPDARAVTWLPSAVLRARRLLDRRRFDCVITSSPPESTHLVALMLGRRRPPWIAEFRDGWSFERGAREFPTHLQRSADRRLEQRVVHGADRLVAATRPIADDLHARFGVEARWIPNGWDPSLEGEVAESTSPPVRPDRVTLVHTGSLSNDAGRDPRALFDAIAWLVEHEPETARRLEVLLAGPLTYSDARLLRANGVAEVARHVGFLPRTEAIALQRRADGLLLLAGEGVSPATSKLSEYLAAHVPIVVLGSSSEAARVVSESGAGVVVNADDPRAIADVLRRAALVGLPQVAPGRRPDELRYPVPAEWFAEELDGLLGAPARSRP